MHRSKLRFHSCLLSLMLLLTAIPTLAEAPATYTTTDFPGFIRVENPNGGKQLSYGPSVKLLEEGGLAFKDLNKNGRLDKYEDWRLPVEERAADLVAQLSMDEVCALMMASYHFGMMGGVSADLDATANIQGMSTRALLDKGVRAILNAASTAPTAPQVEWTNAMQAYVEGAPFGIPVNVFSDPRSNAGSNDGPYDGSQSAVSKWPGSLGFAATFDPEITRQFGELTAAEYRALGITTALSPQIDVGTEPRWPRINGTFGESAQLSADMTVAYVEGFQGTGELGAWGAESVATMVKHWPGDGMGEAGRESHSNGGKYAVYPGDNLDYHLTPFAAVMKDARGAGLAAAVMPSYSIGIAKDGSPLGTDEAQLGSGVSGYKMAEILRHDMAYDGLVCTDWGVAGNFVDNEDGTVADAGGGMAWGTGDLPAGPRVWAGIKVGVDMYGGLDSLGAVKEAYKTAIEEMGETTAEARFRQSAHRAILLSMKLGLFEDPYLDPANSNAVVGNEAHSDAGYDAQLKSIVMLKNAGGIISTAGAEKPTAYIPMQYTPERPGMFGSTPASAAPVIDPQIASEFYNVVTDALKEGADPAAPKPDDIVKRTDFSGVDVALVKVTSPVNPGDMFSGYGYDVNLRNVPGDVDVTGSFGPSQLAYREDQPIDNGYFPNTLQYRTYTADPDVVRQTPIALDEREEAQWVAAGQESGKSRYYGGKSTTATNEYDLNLILDTAKAAQDIPVVTLIAAELPMVFSEFEPFVDAILMGFGVSDRALLEIASGKTEPSGLLPLQMPKDMATVERQLEDVAMDMDCHVDSEGNAYDFAFGLNYTGPIQDARTTKYAAPKAGGSYAAVVEGFDWGPGVTKLILDLDTAIDGASVQTNAFAVTEHKKSFDFQTMTPGESDAPRTVESAYLCDGQGNALDGATSGEHIAIELSVSPAEGNPFYYDFIGSGHNDWADPYTNRINAALTCGGAPVWLDIDAAPASRIMPQADRFGEADSFTKGGIQLTYTRYTPPEDDKKNALIVWLHGAGEGGKDPDVVLLGNKVTALAGDAIQAKFGGAYVLCPQAPTMWMDNGEVDPQTGAPVYVNDTNHVSIYTEALYSLIDSYVQKHPDIDPEKIMIGGCSNGGFMTLNMILNYPG